MVKISTLVDMSGEMISTAVEIGLTSLTSSKVGRHALPVTDMHLSDNLTPSWYLQALENLQYVQLMSVESISW